MKIILANATIKRLLAIAQNGQGNEPACTDDRSGNDWEKICDELKNAKRDSDRRISLSLETFDWVIEEMSWAFETYWNESGE